MSHYRRASDYSAARHITEQLLLRAFATGWFARLHYRLGLHAPLRIWEERISLPESIHCPPLRIVFASDFHAGPMTHRFKTNRLAMLGAFVLTREWQDIRLAHGRSARHHLLSGRS